MDQNGWYPQNGYSQNGYPSQTASSSANGNASHSNSVHEAHQLLGAIPFASATPSSHAARHLSTLSVDAGPPTYMHHQAPQYTYGHQHTYSDYAPAVNHLNSQYAPPQDGGYWTNSRDAAVTLLRDQASRDLQYLPSSYPVVPTSNSYYPTTAFAHSVFQHMSPISNPHPQTSSFPSSLANALGHVPPIASNSSHVPFPSTTPAQPSPPPPVNHPRTTHLPQESPAFFNNFISQTARIPESAPSQSNPVTPRRPTRPDANVFQSSPDPLSMQAAGVSSPLTSVPPTPAVTPMKRKSISLLEPTSVKKMHSEESMRSASSSATKYENSGSSSSNTKVGSGSFTFPSRKPMRVFVEVPPLPKVWTTPTKASVQKRQRATYNFDNDGPDLGGYGTEEDDKPLGTLNFHAPSSVTKSSGRRTGERDERAPLEKFTGLVEDIFEAEDNVPPDAQAMEALSTEFFSPLTTNFPQPLIHPNVVRKVTKSVVKIARPTKRMRATHNVTPQRVGGGLADLDTGFISRLLKLLERSVKVGEDLEPFGKLSTSGGRPPTSPSKVKKTPSKALKKGTVSEPRPSSPPTYEATQLDSMDVDLPESNDEPTTQDVEKLILDLTIARDSVLAADCILAIMSSDRLPKQIYSEELITTCLTVVKNHLSKIIYPFVEASSASAESQATSPLVRHTVKKECSSRVRGPIEDIFQALSSVLPRINSLVCADLVAMSDAIIIQIVYIAIGPFFVDGGPEDTKGKGKEKQVINTLGGSSMRGLRLEALSLIRSVFANHEDQRSWIIEEILTSLLQLSDTKQKAGQFRLRDGRSIRTVSALLLQLVQTSAHGVRIQARKVSRNRKQYLTNKSFTANDTVDDVFLDDFDKEEARFYGSGLDSANKAANTIVVFLISRLGKGKATKNSNEAEYRAIFDHLMADLLVVLFWPEWPAASLLLSIATKYMVKSLDDVKNAGQSENNAVRTMALDHLGVVAARLRSCTLKMDDINTTAASAGRLLPLDEISKRFDRKQLERLITAHEDILDHLAKRGSEDQAYDSARDLTGATWGQELAQALLHCNSSLQVDDRDHDGGKSGITKTSLPAWKYGVKVKNALHDLWADAVSDVFDVGTQQDVLRVDRVAEQIGMLQTLKHTFQPILTVILAALDAPPVFMRTKALRALGQILNNDPTILSAGNVRRAIETHLLDGSPAVRDAAVELIGKYMVDTPAVAGDYYQKLADRIADTGLAVRKRVIKILKSLYSISNDDSRRIDICNKLVLRMFDEDDSVRDLAIKTIEELWFPPTISGSTSRTAASFDDLDGRSRLLSTVVVIMGVSAYFKDRQSPLEDLLYKTITDRSETETTALHRRYADICEVLIEGLVDASDLPGFTVTNCIKCIYLLASAHPTIISVSHASALLPYLKNTSTIEDQLIADYLLRIFRSSVPQMPKTAAKFGQDLQKALQPMILKPSTSGGLATLQETVACMCTVVQSLTHEYSRLIGLLKSCNARMLQYIQRPDTHVLKPQDIRALSVLIFIVALLGEHGSFDKLREDQPTHRTEIDTISKSPITLHLYGSLLRLYKKYEDAGLRSRLLQCLGFLFRAQPTLMTLGSSAGVMDAIFNSNEAEVQARLLKIIQEFLISQSEKHSAMEKNNDKGKASNQDVNMEELVGNTDGFADSGVSSAVVQRYLEHILRAALSQHAGTQWAAVDILTFTIRQGLAHPIQSFPVIVALETSPVTSLSSRAHALHSILHSKHASLLNARFALSARACFDYQKAISPGNVQGLRLEPSPTALLHRWYSLVREKRAPRQDFIKALVKVFDISITLKSSQDDVDFTRFMAENFSAFDYRTQEEVLTVVKYLTSILSTSGMQLVELVSPGNLLSQLRGTAETRPPHIDGDVVMSEPSASDLDSGGQALEDSLGITRTSIIISIIMLLKAHLKLLYGLSEEKCSKFLVGKKSAIGDKAATKRRDEPLTWKDRLAYAIAPVQTTDDQNKQHRRFLEIWNEDGVTHEPEDDEFV